jgi:hypothetical protein
MGNVGNEAAKTEHDIMIVQNTLERGIFLLIFLVSHLCTQLSCLLLTSTLAIFRSFSPLFNSGTESRDLTRFYLSFIYRMHRPSGITVSTS